MFVMALPRLQLRPGDRLGQLHGGLSIRPANSFWPIWICNLLLYTWGISFNTHPWRQKA